jgi:tripartite-type tricarboxylate transporter receptor subunit TctC
MRGLIAFGLALVLMSASGAAHAQDTYPSRPVKVVVPFAAGGSTDVLGRLAAQILSEQLGQRFFVENVNGAGGALGAAQVAKAAPDGYTLLIGTPGSMTVNPHIQANIAYDTLRDFAPISLIGNTPGVALVPTSSPIMDLRQLIAAAKAKPGALTFGSAGVGSFFHLAAELFKYRAGVDMTHVPYRGVSQAVVDLYAGRIDVMFGSVQSYLSASGKLRALAVAAPKRSSLAGEIPTAAEAGLAGYQTGSWTGVLAPARLPGAVLAALNAALRKGLQDPAMVKHFADIGLEPAGNSPQEFAQFIAAEFADIGKLVELAQMKPQ